MLTVSLHKKKTGNVLEVSIKQESEKASNNCCITDYEAYEGKGDSESGQAFSVQWIPGTRKW